MGARMEAKCMVSNGVGEIRTHGTVTRSAVFKTAALNHSATTPQATKFLHRCWLRNPPHSMGEAAHRLDLASWKLCRRRS